MGTEIFEQYFVKWKYSLKNDAHNFDFTTIVKNLPSMPELACLAIGRMIEELFAASTEHLQMSQLSVISGEMSAAVGNQVSHLDPEAHTRLLEAVLVISHSLKNPDPDTDAPSIHAFITSLQNKRLQDCVQFLTSKKIVLESHEWYGYVSNNLMGSSWTHIASIYDVDNMPTSSVALLMNTLHPTLIQNQTTDAPTPYVVLPPNLNA